MWSTLEKHRILYRMKVTAILPDELIQSIKEETGGKNITQSLTIALTQWLKQTKINNLISQIDKKPLQFQEDFSASKIRETNRSR